MKYAGLDVHDRTVVVHIVDGAGTTLHTAIVPTELARIRAALRCVRGPLTVAFEEGALASWLCAGLRRHVADVVVCDPRRNRLLMHGSRSDRTDAARIAEFLRLGAVRSIYHGDSASERLRTLAHHYNALTGDVIRAKLRLRAVFRSRAIPTGGTAFFHQRNRAKYLHALRSRPAEYLRAGALFRQLDFTAQEQSYAREALLAEAAASPAFVLLQSFPCVGPVRAAVFIAIVGTPDRFANRRRFWKYAGLSVRHSASGEHMLDADGLHKVESKVRTRGLDRRCNYLLKRVLRDVAAGVLASRGCLRMFYERLVGSGKSPTNARITVARKVAATLLAVWRSLRPFDPALFMALSLRPAEASPEPFPASHRRRH
ncbi:MAG: transposase [Acidobacteriota bacterium]|nr:transposase [Acidobacteriota bacterium]